MESTLLQLVLYTAAGCCLCETLREQIASLSGEIPLSLEVVDITDQPELERQFRTEIPVLLVNGRRVVKYRISTEALRQRLLEGSGAPREGVRRLR